MCKEDRMRMGKKKKINVKALADGGKTAITTATAPPNPTTPTYYLPVLLKKKKKE